MITFELIRMELQIFAAGGGVLTNATGNYVNSYTGDTTSFSGSNTLAIELKDFYDTELLENTRMQLIYAQFAKRQNLPKGHKGTVEFRKFNTFANAEALTEGVIPTGQKMGVTYLTASITQYGTYVSISDKLELRAYDDVILQATEEMSASAAQTQETLTRDGLLVGTNVLYCDIVDPDTGAYVSTPASAQALKADAAGISKLTATMVNKAVSIMRKNKVPTIDGTNYAAVVHPSVAFDLKEDERWENANVYGDPDAILNGEIGKLLGMRFFENADAPVLKGADLASDSRTLKINHGAGYSGAITSVAFDGGTVATDALNGRYISINGVVALVTDSDASSITFASTNFGTIADDTVIYPAEYGPGDIAAYATYVFGKDGFVIIDPEGGNLEMIVHDKDEAGGPLNQFSTIGYKFETNGATILYQERVLRVMSCSTFSGADSAN